MNFDVLVVFDEEYQGYVVDVPQLNGCMSQGKTIEEALTNIKDAIQGWLLVENSKGNPYISTYKQMFLTQVAI
ncbi:MAG: type II toxin-antitoxin system HicB family antitoxin [Candidatus Kapabacteria bacterium]|nr:type II toxin-antitoxin system HicB family antitoxin [Candidatus Kapabacteria bacterium]